jgi:hypothetical protein
VSQLVEALRAARERLPEAFRTSHARLFEPEHLERLAQRLERFHREGVPDAFPLPHFAAECTPPLAECFAPFRAALEGSQDWAEALTAAGTPRILAMLGQRFTPASVTDARGIAPTRAQLLSAAEQLHTPSDPLTTAARALTKHVHRSPEKFWGEVRGSTAQKNAAARRVLEHILDNATWLNVFGHFAHELVYEARVPTGHGARWAHDGTEFVGFLEPFDEEKCPSLS